MSAVILVSILGGLLISGKCSTTKFGVKGSGSLIVRGNADKIRLRICTQLGGITSQNV